MALGRKSHCLAVYASLLSSSSAIAALPRYILHVVLAFALIYAVLHTVM
jgi:hypothetical protein